MEFASFISVYATCILLVCNTSIYSFWSSVILFDSELICVKVLLRSNAFSMLIRRFRAGTAIYDSSLLNSQLDLVLICRPVKEWEPELAKEGRASSST